MDNTEQTKFLAILGGLAKDQLYRYDFLSKKNNERCCVFSLNSSKPFTAFGKDGRTILVCFSFGLSEAEMASRLDDMKCGWKEIVEKNPQLTKEINWVPINIPYEQAKPNTE